MTAERRRRRGLLAGLCFLLLAGGPLAAEDERLPERRRRRPPGAAAEPQVFLRAEAVPPRPFVGQQVLYTLYLYTDADVDSIRPRNLPDFRGFWSRPLPPAEPVPESAADGELYRFVLFREALFPRRGGRFEIPPVAASMEAKVRDSGAPGSPRPGVHEVTRVSNPVVVEVRELPPAPAGFRGAVGELALDAELAPRQLEVGEAATLTLTLRGRGHLQGIPAPELPAPAGLEVFAPQQQSVETFHGTEVAGRRTWSYVLVPERPGEWRLPAIEMPYFDPRQERYRTAHGPELGLVARSSRHLSRESGETVELHPIRTAALPRGAAGGVDGRRLRPWLFGLPWVLGAIVLLLRRRRGEGGDIHGALRARYELARRLRAADGERRPRQAAAEIEEAWRGFLEARWGIPRSVPGARWGSLAADRGADAASAAALAALADDLHYLRYAPKLAAAEGLRRELRDRSRKLLRGLR